MQSSIRVVWKIREELHTHGDGEAVPLLMTANCLAVRSMRKWGDMKYPPVIERRFPFAPGKGVLSFHILHGGLGPIQAWRRAVCCMWLKSSGEGSFQIGEQEANPVRLVSARHITMVTISSPQRMTLGVLSCGS